MIRSNGFPFDLITGSGWGTRERVGWPQALTAMGEHGWTRIVVRQQRPRVVGGPTYHLTDADGLSLGTVVERPGWSGRKEERAATLDMYDEEGGPVYRLTRDPRLVDQICAANGWGPLRPWGYVLLGADEAPVAWARAESWSHRPWHVHCLGIDTPIEIRDQRVGTGRKTPRPVTMGGVPVGQITLVSGWNTPDTYVFDLFHGAPEGGLATTFAALVPLYDQIFREAAPVRAAGGTSSWD